MSFHIILMRLNDTMNVVFVMRYVVAYFSIRIFVKKQHRGSPAYFIMNLVLKLPCNQENFEIVKFCSHNVERCFNDSR